MKEKNDKKWEERKLIIFLSIATFFDGYDFMAITQILPNLRNDLKINEFEIGLFIAFINLGAMISFFLIRYTDRIGRKKFLNITIIGYTISTFLTAFSYDIYTFSILQFFGRIFLVAETAVAYIFAAEEVSANKRGFVIGLIQGSLSLGMIFCAAVTPMMINTEIGWRGVYLVGIIPLLLIAFSRRNIEESKRYKEFNFNHNQIDLKKTWNSPYKKRIIQVGLIWLFSFLCTQSAFMFWKEFAVNERSLTDTQVGLAISIASLISLPIIFFTGKLIDKIGRKKSALIIYTIEILAVIASYSLFDFIGLLIALIFGIFGISAVMIINNTLTTELFPTSIRGSAFAWTNNLIGRIGFIISPILVGYFAQNIGWGLSVISTSIGLVISMFIIYFSLPEANNQELEISSKVLKRKIPPPKNSRSEGSS